MATLDNEQGRAQGGLARDGSTLRRTQLTAAAGTSVDCTVANSAFNSVDCGAATPTAFQGWSLRAASTSHLPQPRSGLSMGIAARLTLRALFAEWMRGCSRADATTAAPAVATVVADDDRRSPRLYLFRNHRGRQVG